MLHRLVRLLEGSDRVGLAAIFVTSAFGYGKARQLEQPSAATAAAPPKGFSLLSEGEPEWILKEGEMPAAAQPDRPGVVVDHGGVAAQEGRPPRRGDGPHGPDAARRPESHAGVVSCRSIAVPCVENPTSARGPVRPAGPRCFSLNLETTMNEPMLIFETDPQTGTPRLKASSTAPRRTGARRTLATWKNNCVRATKAWCAKAAAPSNSRARRCT